MKRIVSALLVLCMLAVLIPVQALAYGSYNIWVYSGYEFITVSHETASPGEKITVTPKAGYKITFLQACYGEAEFAKVTEEGQSRSFVMPEGNVELMVYVESTGGGNAGYPFTVISAGGGAPVADKAAAASGEKVTITPNPDPGNVMQKIVLDYYDNSGMNRFLEYTTTSFTMPADIKSGAPFHVIVYYEAGGNSGDNDGGNTGDNDGGNTGDNDGGNTGDNDGGSTGGNTGSGLNFNYGYDVYRSPAYPKKGSSFTVYNFANPLDADGYSRVGNAAQWSLTPVGKFGSFKGTAANTNRITSVFTSTASNYGVAADDLTVYQLTRNGGLITYGVLVMHNPDENVAMFIGGNYSGGAGYFFANVEQSGSKHYDVTTDASDTAGGSGSTNSNIQHVTDPGDNKFSADIQLDDPEVLRRLLPESDLNSGKNIKVWLSVEELTDVPAVDKAAIDRLAMNGSKQIAAYLDITMFKQVENEERERISKTNGDVPISMVLSADVIPAGAHKDSFSIIYYHGGAAKELKASFDPASKTLTFHAFEFSTYALAFDPSTGASGGTLDNVPRTGDITGLSGWTMVALCSIMMLAGAFLCGKKRAR